MCIYVYNIHSTWLGCYVELCCAAECSSSSSSNCIAVYSSIAKGRHSINQQRSYSYSAIQHSLGARAAHRSYTAVLQYIYTCIYYATALSIEKGTHTHTARGQLCMRSTCCNGCTECGKTPVNAIILYRPSDPPLVSTTTQQGTAVI